MALMAIYVGAVWSMFAGGATVALFMATSWYLYVEKGILLDVVSAGIAGFLIYSVLTYLNYVREGYEKQQVRGAFAQYMSPALVEQLVDEAGPLPVVPLAGGACHQRVAACLVVITMVFNQPELFTIEL